MLSYKRIKHSCSPVRGSSSLTWKIIYLLTVHPNGAIQLLSTYWEQVAKSSSLMGMGWYKDMYSYRYNDTYMHLYMPVDIATQIQVCTVWIPPAAKHTHSVCPVAELILTYLDGFIP